MTLLLFLALLLPAAADTTGAPPDPARQVITRAEIEAAGLFDLNDLFRLVRGARRASVEGFEWRVSLGAGDPFGEEAWTLLVDGTRVDLGLFGRQDLALLPVAITQVDSVEVWTAPRVAGGTLAWGGVIHLHTTRPQQGPRLRTGAAIGNEVGDPGPFRYVPERATPNVDKFGADYEALAGYGARGWRAAAAVTWRRFYATDPATVGRRAQAQGGLQPRIGLLAPRAWLEGEAFGGRHALAVLGGGSDGFWFFEPIGREVPAQRRWGQVALRGRFPVAPAAALTYGLAAGEQRLAELDASTLGLDPAWRQRTLRANAEGTWTPGAYAAMLGLTAERITADGADAFTLGTAYATLTRTVPRQQQRLDAALSVAAGDVAASAALSTRHTLGPHTVAVTAALAQRLPAQAARYGFWRARGYDALPILDVRAAPPEVTTRALLQADARLGLGPRLTAEAGAAVQALRGLYLEVQPEGAPDPDGPPRSHPLHLVPDASGEVVSGYAAVRGAWGPWTARLAYDGQRPLGGDAAFRGAWRAVPRHHLGAEVAVRPDPGFAVRAALTWRSAARWPAYAALSGGNDGHYNADVPAAWLLDAAVEKGLWQRRLRASLLFRNLLNQEERYHPLGAALDLRFYLRVELLLGR